jgi:(2Fe-2S) ferredoxin
MSRFRHHLFICQNERSADDPRGSCRARGADALAETAKEEVHRLGLKGKVRANKAGCLDACGRGPVCVVYPEGVWYAPRNADDMREIVASHLANGVTVERLRIEQFD